MPTTPVAPAAAKTAAHGPTSQQFVDQEHLAIGQLMAQHARREDSRNIRLTQHRFHSRARLMWIDRHIRLARSQYTNCCYQRFNRPLRHNSYATTRVVLLNNLRDSLRRSIQFTIRNPLTARGNRTRSAKFLKLSSTYSTIAPFSLRRITCPVANRCHSSRSHCDNGEKVS